MKRKGIAAIALDSARIDSRMGQATAVEGIEPICSHLGAVSMKDPYKLPCPQYTNKGMRCRKCRGGYLHVVYTRQGRLETVVRRRECLKCGTRFTTRER